MDTAGYISIDKLTTCESFFIGKQFQCDILNLLYE